jgi:lactate racemase
MQGARAAAGGTLSQGQVRAVLEAGLPPGLLRGRRILVLTPDATRTCPLPFLVRSIAEIARPAAARLDFMVALGTHTPLDDRGIDALYGIGPGERETVFRDTRFLAHRWDLPGTFRRLGVIGRERIEQLTGGLFSESVAVDINAAIFDYDVLLIAGPVFPHEVAGFSGGHKYLFPGISGGDFLHFTHWLGAVHTCAKTIGVKDTPVRALLEAAAFMVPVPRLCISLVVTHAGDLAGISVGEPRESWSAAADHSSEVHVVRTARTFHTVLGTAPRMYDELWTAAKVMYKLEPVVADGGRLIIHAPHVRELSRTWGAQVAKVGFHVRDYFLGRMERFADVPRAVLAHSTHVRGAGTFEGGVERPRIEVILATGIPEQACRAVNLGYRDPARIDPAAFAGREEEGVLFVPQAGEVLYRLQEGRAGQEGDPG